MIVNEKTYERVDTLGAVGIIKKALEKTEREETADVMCELLFDDENSTYKMFEEMAMSYLNENDDVRKGINIACSILTGWNLETIASSLLDSE